MGRTAARSHQCTHTHTLAWVLGVLTPGHFRPSATNRGRTAARSLLQSSTQRVQECRTQPATGQSKRTGRNDRTIRPMRAAAAARRHTRTHAACLSATARRAAADVTSFSVRGAGSAVSADRSSSTERVIVRHEPRQRTLLLTNARRRRSQHRCRLQRRQRTAHTMGASRAVHTRTRVRVLHAAVADSRSAPPCRVARRTQQCRVCASRVYRSAHEVSSPRSIPT